jgi:nucleotide-binding universal stress UspA family protein
VSVEISAGGGAEITTLESLRFRRILVPVDESRPSQNSLAVAAGLARETGAEVILSHVVQMRWSQNEPEMKATYGEIIDDYRRSGESTLRRTAESEVFSGLDVDTQLLFGNNPARELLRLAKDRGADAIVMGSHGRGGFGRMILGSVSQRVVHDATVPVIIVPPHLERAEEASA